MLKELYWRLVNAITKWLLHHCPEAIRENLLTKDKAQLKSPEAFADFYKNSIKRQLHQLWDNCPPNHLLVIVLEIGLPDQEIDVDSRIADIVNNPPLNENGDPDSLATILGYGYAILSTTSPQSGMNIHLFNPGRHHERGINPNLDGMVEHWFHNDYDSRQTIVGWQYVPIPKDEPKAE